MEAVIKNALSYEEILAFIKGVRWGMKKYAQKRIDMYDIGNGLTLMNVINKNENGKLHQITTYIGIEGNGFVCVGNANDLDAPGTIFSYQTYVREQEAMLPVLRDIFETNTGVK